MKAPVDMLKGPGARQARLVLAQLAGLAAIAATEPLSRREQAFKKRAENAESALRAARREHVIERNAESLQRAAGVHEPQPFEGLSEAHVLAQAPGADGAVEAPIGAEKGDVHRLAAAAPGVGLSFEGGQYLVVVGERRYALNELRLHGFISDDDVFAFRCVLKYLQKVGASVEGRP